MGWFERLSGSDDDLKDARSASVAEEIEIKRWRAHHRPLESDESLAWEGHLFTGYHLRRAERDASTEYIKTQSPYRWAKIND